MKALWILNHYAVPPSLPGGTRHFDLGRELVRRGWDVTIWASGFHYAQRRETRLRPGETWRLETIDGVRFAWLRTTPYRENDARRVRNMISYTARVFRLGLSPRALPGPIPRPDVILGSSVHLLAPLAAWGLALRHRARFVMEVRDLWPQTLIDMGLLPARGPVTRSLQALEKFLYRRARAIVVLPPLARLYIAPLGIREDKIVWIPNGVDLRRFGPPASPPSGPDWRILYTGAFGETNGLETLIRAAAMTGPVGGRPVRFVLTGDGPEKERLRALAARLGLANVELRDPVPKSEVPRLLAGADILVHIEKDIPNLVRYGSAPNKFMDYLAAGRPIVVSSSFIKDRLDELGAGLRAKPDDAADLARAVRSILEMPPGEKAAMGRRARAHAEATYDIEKLAVRLESVLE